MSAFNAYRKRTPKRLLIVGLLTLSVMQVSCVTTDDLELSSEVYACSTFTATVTCTMQGSSSGEYGTTGWFALLMPVGWTLDSVFCDGSGYSLEMIPDDYFSSYLIEYFYLNPPPPWLEWESFITDQDVLVEEGDVWTGTLHVSTDGLVGIAELVALAATNGYEGIEWSGDPCTTTVDVQELHLDQTTWGAIKNSFRN